MKIFQIGFNRCGTRSLYSFFDDNVEGFKNKCVHWDEFRLATSMFKNFLNNKKLLSDYENCLYFGDMETWIRVNNELYWLYAHKVFYKLLDEQYPGSKFILNIRDREDWIVSRTKHTFQYSKQGSRNCYINALCEINNLIEHQQIEAWREDWQAHIEGVKDYFKNRSNDLLIYDINKDSPVKIIDFFKDDLKFINIPDKLPHLHKSTH